MPFLKFSEFDAAYLGVELQYTRPKTGKPRPQLKVFYGPDRSALSFVTPLVVCDWPKLGADGNYGSNFGPEQLEKAQWQVGITDRAVLYATEGPLNCDGVLNAAAAQFFNTMRAIDEKVAEAVYEHRKEILGDTTLTREVVRAKMMPTVRNKLEEGVPLYQKMQLSARVFDWDGNRRSLDIVKRGKPYDGDSVKHGDVVRAAIVFDCFYTVGNGFGIKWGLVQLQHVQDASPSHQSVAKELPFSHFAEDPEWAT